VKYYDKTLISLKRLASFSMIHLITIKLFLLAFLMACNSSSTITTEKEKPQLNIESTRQKSKEALEFCKAKNFNSDFCILIDMSLHSGIKRFLVWDFNKDSIMYSFLVGHGCCANQWSDDNSKDNPQFSNADGSHCSSLGKYKIGERGYSEWGIRIKYALYGLEVSNSNAFARSIVLHSWEEIPDEEIYPEGTAEGWGCPALSNNSFKILDTLLKASTKPVLLWIYK
jgi:hypothetical protein